MYLLRDVKDNNLFYLMPQMYITFCTVFILVTSFNAFNFFYIYVCYTNSAYLKTVAINTSSFFKCLFGQVNNTNSFYSAPSLLVMQSARTS